MDQFKIPESNVVIIIQKGHKLGRRRRQPHGLISSLKEEPNQPPLLPALRPYSRVPFCYYP